jgi:hypothetical protein
MAPFAMRMCERREQTVLDLYADRLDFSMFA